MARGGGYDGGGGGGGRGGRGGKGGKGQKPQFTRVIPKFLQQYETMLNGPKPPRTGGEDEVFSGGGEFVDGGGAAMGGGSGMPGRGRGKGDDGIQGGGGASVGGGGGGSGFEDYDEEEVAALEAYMKTHPSKEEDKEALRKRAKQLSASIGSGQGDSATDAVPRSKQVGAGMRGSTVASPPPEPPIEYTDASGKLKFNKRPAAVSTEAEKQGGLVDIGEARDGKGGGKRKGKRSKLAKLNNTKLLSFGDDEYG